MPWASLANVKAVLHAGLPGQESGNSIVDVLYGAYNPSAKLPYVIPNSLADYPRGCYYNISVEPSLTSDLWASASTAIDFGLNNFLGKAVDINYTEGVFLDYRWMQSKGIKPRYPFGFGLR